MSDLGSQVYNLQMQNLVTLWVIDFNPVLAFDPPAAGILRLSAYHDASNNDIVYDGNTYEFVGIASGGFRSEINGTLPEPQITLDKNSLTALAQYQSIKNSFLTETGQVYFDWRGATVRRIRTTDSFLGDPTRSDIDDFVVDQITRTTKSTIEVKLAVSVGADRINNLSVQELSANRCALRYRDRINGNFVYTNEGAGGCPYGNPTTASDWSAVPGFGTNYFTDADQVTANPDLDQCSYSVKGCQLRFDPDQEGLTLPFTGVYKPTGNNGTGNAGSL